MLWVPEWDQPSATPWSDEMEVCDGCVPSPPLETKSSRRLQHLKTCSSTMESQDQRPALCATSFGTHHWHPDLGDRSGAKQPPNKTQWDAHPT